MHSDATTPAAYLAGLPDDRRPVIETVRRLVAEHAPDGLVEVVQHGMLSWVVPLERSGGSYNGLALPLVSLASQKRHMALYLMGIYADPDGESWLRRRWAETGKKLDLGKSCLRFKPLDDLALDVVAEAVARMSVDELIAAQQRAHPKRPSKQTRG